MRHRPRGRHVRPSPAGRHGGLQPRPSPARRGDLEAAARLAARQTRLSRGRTRPHAQGRQAQLVLDPGEQQSAGGPQQQRGDLSRIPQSE